MQNTDEEEETNRTLRELALIDRVLGLEAEVARLNIQAGVNDVRVLQSSKQWRIGRIVLAPASFIRRLMGK